MDIRDISRKISAFGQRMKDTTKSVESQLEEREELYRDAVDGTDEIIRWLRFYKRDPENPANSFSDSILPEYRLTSLNNAVSESPRIVSKNYQEYRDEVPLLTGEEQDFTAVYDSEWRKFKRRVDKHIEFTRQLRKEFREALGDIEDAQERLDREQYRKESKNQRGDSYSIDKEEVMPDRRKTELTEDIYEMVSEKIEEETEDESKEEEDESSEDGDMPLMTTRQYVHYMIEYLKMNDGHSSNGSEYYRILKDGFPDQAEVIERNVHTVWDLNSIDFEKEGMISLKDGEVQYIKDRIKGEKRPDKTLEDFKNEYEEKELDRIAETN